MATYRDNQSSVGHGPWTSNWGALTQTRNLSFGGGIWKAELASKLVDLALGSWGEALSQFTALLFPERESMGVLIGGLMLDSPLCAFPAMPVKVGVSPSSLPAGFILGKKEGGMSGLTV